MLKVEVNKMPKAFSILKIIEVPIYTYLMKQQFKLL